MGTTRLNVYNDALRSLGEVPLATLGDDAPARYALDNAYDDAVLFMLRQGAWRFATTTAVIPSSAGTATAGYTFQFTRPADWLYTHAIFKLADGSREIPIDVREERASWFANLPAITVRYVSTAYADPQYWSQTFQEVMSAYLAYQIAYRVAGGLQTVGDAEKNFAQLLQLGLAQDALPANRWLRFQLSGMFINSVRYVLEHGMWRFATKTVAILPDGTPVPGTGARIPKPADWVRTIDVVSPGGAASTADNTITVTVNGGVF